MHITPESAAGGRDSQISPPSILAPMELLMDIPQTLIGDVGVDLGGRHVFVSQQLLDAAQIGAMRQEVVA